MSVEAARLHVTVTSDTDPARRGLLGLGNDVDHTSHRFGSAVGGMAALGTKAFVAIGAAAVVTGAALVKGFASAVGASSDLSETMNKANVVFGDSAGVVTAFGENAARSLGMSKNEAIGAAATFGNLFSTIGIGKAPAADMSTRLVTLSSDLASFNNMDPTEVLEKLRSGLSGEVEPLRSMGVFLNEATVKAKAMEMGLADSSGELSEAAKVQARYALILEQTSVAHGDFANTSKGLANQQRILKGQWEDLKAAIGDQLRPALERAAGSMTGQLMPAMQKLAPVIGALAEPVAHVISRVIDMAGKWLGEAGRVAQATSLIQGGFNRAGEALTAFLTGVQGADAGGFLQTLKDLWESVSPLVGAMTDLGTAIITKLGPELPRVIEALADLAVAITPAFVALVEALAVAVDHLPTPVVAAAVGMFFFKDGILAVHGALKLLVGSGLLNTLGTKLATLGMAASGVTTPAAGLGVVGGIAGFAAAIAVVGKQLEDEVQKIDVTKAETSLGDKFSGFFSRLPGILMGPATPFATLGTLITSKFGDAFAGVGGAIGDFVTKIPGFFARLPGVIGGALSGLGGIIGGALSGLGGIIGGALSTAGSAVAGFVTSLPGRLAGLATAIGGVLTQLPGIIGGFLAALPQRAAFFAGHFVGTMVRTFATLPMAIFQVGPQVIGAVMGFLGQLPGLIGGFVSGAVSLFASIWSGLIGIAGSVLGGVIGAVGGFLGQLPGMVGGFISSAVSTFTGIISALPGVAISTGASVIGAVVDFMSQLPGKVVEFASQLPGKIGEAVSGMASAVSGLAGSVLSAFADMGSSIIRWAADLPGKLWNAALDIGRSFVDGIKKGLGVGSPSIPERLFAAMATNIASSVGDVRSSMGDLGHVMARGGGLTLGGGRVPALARVGAGAGGSVTVVNHIDARGSTMTKADFESVIDRRMAPVLEGIVARRRAGVRR